MQVLNSVMVIDDDPITSILLEKINATANFTKEVISFYSAVDGLDYLLSLKDNRQVAPQVIFLDIKMPIVNGWQFLERYGVLDIPKEKTAIYMLTASADQSDIIRAKKFAYVQDYLVKPLTLSRLQFIQASLNQTSTRAHSSAI